MFNFIFSGSFPFSCFKRNACSTICRHPFVQYANVFKWMIYFYFLSNFHSLHRSTVCLCAHCTLHRFERIWIFALKNYSQLQLCAHVPNISFAAGTKLWNKMHYVCEQCVMRLSSIIYLTKQRRIAWRTRIFNKKINYELIRHAHSTREFQSSSHPCITQAVRSKFHSWT